MKSPLNAACLGAAILAIPLAVKSTQAEGEVPYPEGYRQWTHVKTAIIGHESPAFARFGGIHHIYANKKAQDGYKTGHFEDGSILVFDVLHAVLTKTDVEEGERKFVDVMVKDSSLYKGTGGWGFEEFKGNSKTERTVRHLASSECFKCHASRKESGYVFSRMRD
jgi:hypothetical protein